MGGGLQTKTGDEVNYASIGSGAFGASDMPLTPDDLAKHNLIQFRTVQLIAPLLRQQRSPVPNHV